YLLSVLAYPGNGKVPSTNCRRLLLSLEMRLDPENIAAGYRTLTRGMDETSKFQLGKNTSLYHADCNNAQCPRRRGRTSFCGIPDRVLRRHCRRNCIPQGYDRKYGYRRYRSRASPEGLGCSEYTNTDLVHQQIRSVCCLSVGHPGCGHLVSQAFSKRRV